jgi:dipeptidase E
MIDPLRLFRGTALRHGDEGNRRLRMQLYLSSYRMGDQFDQLVAAIPSEATVAVVSNAVDFIPVADRLAYARNIFDPVEHFRTHGLAAIDLDLRAYFGRVDALRSALDDVRLVWAIGGNAFLLRRAMAQSGLDQILKDRIAARTLIYGGWSAGAVVAGPSLRGLDLMDDPDVVVDDYMQEPVWEGLGLVDFSIVPHFQSAHPEAGAAARAAAWLAEQGLPFRVLRDGEVIIA